jgi:hypothetical protein
MSEEFLERAKGSRILRNKRVAAFQSLSISNEERSKWLMCCGVFFATEERHVYSSVYCETRAPEERHVLAAGADWRKRKTYVTGLRQNSLAAYLFHPNLNFGAQLFRGRHMALPRSAGVRFAD